MAEIIYYQNDDIYTAILPDGSKLQVEYNDKHVGVRHSTDMIISQQRLGSEIDEEAFYDVYTKAQQHHDNLYI